MRKVRCVSPHGGCHHGMRADNGLPAHPGFGGPLKLAANEGGWVDCPALGGHVAVGAVVDAREAPLFIADGFHFVDDGTGLADECAGPGGSCWCGGAHHAPPPDDDAQDDEIQADDAPAPAAFSWTPPAPAPAAAPDTTEEM